MRFLLDAHLPKHLAEWLQKRGHDVMHTLDLPQQNRTTDTEIIKIAIQQERIIITKDNDFRNYFVLKGAPPKLLLLTTGNLRNKDLIFLFDRSIATLEYTLLIHQVVELSKEAVTVHF